MTRVINFWAGPGAGKSTIASDLFAEMKWRGYNVEIVNETAKELTWEGHHNVLEDQLYVSAMQNRKLQRLIGQVDWIITDSPLLLSVAYIPAHYQPSFESMILDMWNAYDNVNYFVSRQKKYVAVGRRQTEEEAREVDGKLIELMDFHAVDYTTIPGDRSAKLIVIDDLIKRGLLE